MEKGAWGDGDKLEKGEKGPGLGNVGEVLVSPLRDKGPPPQSGGVGWGHCSPAGPIKPSVQLRKVRCLSPSPTPCRTPTQHTCAARQCHQPGGTTPMSYVVVTQLQGHIPRVVRPHHILRAPHIGIGVRTPAHLPHKSPLLETHPLREPPTWSQLSPTPSGPKAPL